MVRIFARSVLTKDIKDDGGANACLGGPESVPNVGSLPGILILASLNAQARPGFRRLLVREGFLFSVGNLEVSLLVVSHDLLSSAVVVGLVN